MKVECIDYRDLPGQNPLFLDYLYDFGRVSGFYRPLPETSEQWRARADAVLELEHFPRQRLIVLLEQYNRDLGVSGAAVDNLELLSDPSTVAVVTGQQVGLLGGPCYTAYKAATAVDLARRLRGWGIPAVPVFWLAADDSDFDEVCSTQFVDGEGQLFSVRHPDVRSRDQQMAGTTPIAEWDFWLGPVTGALESGLPSERIREGLLNAYAPHRTFREAFARWISSVFRDEGLILFDPLIEGYRSGLLRLFETAISRRADLVRASLECRSRLRQEGFEPQVMVDESETFLFLIEDEARYKLEASGGEYRVKERPGIRYTPEALLQALSSGDVKLAPNVLLRPLVQDYLFPTVAAVGGPAEVAYFAQVDAIASAFGSEPLVYPRSAFTIVDRKSRRLLEKYQLPVARFLQMSEYELAELLLRGNGRQPVLEKLEELRDSMTGGLRLIYDGPLSESLENPEIDMTRKAESRIRYQIDRVKDRFVANRAQRDTVVRGHLSHLTHHLTPRQKLQERSINFNYFLNEGGPGFIGELIRAVGSECFAHKVLYL